eukprot:TRINITY_DN12281_c0_g1_i1.p1 TRINITY_DN12281_c0_g1~~TRINITY_DN12281_c0_g1_i1.p1  ORF type:complete len:235 (-),score=72.12 TRINITY_DN12281_c0_g1_i1:32-682(-)
MAEVPADEYTLEEKREMRLRKIFEKADKDGNGFLDSKELRHVVARAFKKNDIDFDSKLIYKYSALQMDKHDADGNGELEFEEFVELYNNLIEDPELPISLKRRAEDADMEYQEHEVVDDTIKVPKQETNLSDDEIAVALEKFDSLDADNSGTIDKEELKVLLRERFGTKMSDMMLGRIVEGQFQMADTDGDGEIDKDEFVIFYKKLYQDHGNMFRN